MMNKDPGGIKPGFTIRSDIFGFYVCTAAEAEQTDNGAAPSCGYDLRPHWLTFEAAASALRNWQPARPSPRKVQPTTSVRRPLATTEASSRAAVHAQRQASAATPPVRRMPFA